MYQYVLVLLSIGSGKSCVLATIAERLKSEGDDNMALVYITCKHAVTTTRGTDHGSSQSLTVAKIYRTALFELCGYVKSAADEREPDPDHELLKSCNAIFQKAKQMYEARPDHLRARNGDLSDFSSAFCEIATLLKRRAALVIDEVNRTSLSKKEQTDLKKKIDALIAQAAKHENVKMNVLLGCSEKTEFIAHPP